MTNAVSVTDTQDALSSTEAGAGAGGTFILPYLSNFPSNSSTTTSQYPDLI